MAALALSIGSAAAKADATPALVAARRVDFHLKGNSFSRWKYRQVDCFIAASEAIRQMLIADGVPADRDGHRPRRHRRRARRSRRRPSNVHEAFWLPHGAPVVGNVAALVPHKGQRYLIDAAHLVVQQMPDARFVILGEGELREHLEQQVQRAPPREARAAARLPHRRPRLHQGLRSVRDELGHRRARHVAARRDGLRAADRRHARRRHSGDRRGRRQRAAGAAARSRALADGDRPRAEGRGAAPADGRGRLRAASTSASPSSGWCEPRRSTPASHGSTDGAELPDADRQAPRSGHCAVRLRRG